MKIGINLFLWTHFVQEKHFMHLDDLKTAGYDGVEIPIIEGHEQDYIKLAEAIKNAGLECTSTSTCKPGKNIISDIPEVRQSGQDHLKWAIEMSAILESQMIGGPLHSAPGIFSGNMPTQTELHYASENLHACGEFASSLGQKLSLEFLNRFESYLVTNVEQTKELVQMIGLPNIGIHYDTHHAHYEEYSIKEAIKLGGKDIHHIQLSESNRGLPGKGQVNWIETFNSIKQIGYDGWLVIESFTHKTKALREALHIWRELYSNEEECYLAGLELIKKYW
ncbi:MAG: sugar phosphate isomerase/epimerase [Lentisphaeraceae bacterium]|nr:sugar phosphate isomerase/epimerase [Lentisphaeraceae bacterium]